MLQEGAGTGSAVDQAQAALEAGNPEAAIRTLRLWVNQHSGNTRARVLLGRAYEAAGDLMRAQAQFQLALKAAPESPDALAALGTLYDRSGDPEKAEPYLARAATFSKDSQGPRLAWAVVLAKLHRYRGAAIALRNTHPPAADPERIAYFRLRASVELGNGSVESAARDMKSALALSPQDPSLQAGAAVAEAELAAAQFRAGQLGAALTNATRARSLRESAAIDSLIGDIQERQGASLDAVHSFQRAVSLEPESEQYWLDLALELLRHETYEPALMVLEQAAPKFPSSVRIRLATGLAQYFLEDYQEAIRSLLSASRMNAGSSLAIDYLGQIQLQQPITPESDAVNAVCHYAEAHPQRAEEMMYCGALMARMEHRRGETKPSPGALRWLSTAAQLAPHLALARCELGKNLAWAGEWYPAQTQMEACVRLEPDSAEGHYRLAQIYLHLGQTERARRETILHNQVMRHMVAANAQRDATLKKFLYTMTENAATVR